MNRPNHHDIAVLKRRTFRTGFRIPTRNPCITSQMLKPFNYSIKVDIHGPYSLNYYISPVVALSLIIREVVSSTTRAGHIKP
jgi:hypothetical protein